MAKLFLGYQFREDHAKVVEESVAPHMDVGSIQEFCERRNVE